MGEQRMRMYSFVVLAHHPAVVFQNLTNVAVSRHDVAGAGIGLVLLQLPCLLQQYWCLVRDAFL
jgi:hypothetical protein